MRKKLKIFFVFLLAAFFVGGSFLAVRWMARISSESVREEIKEIAKDENAQGKPENSKAIIIDIPKAEEEIASPLEIRGKARGSWFFEGSFPIRLVDEKGNVLASVTAKALSDWMTVEFVPFEASIIFSSPGSGMGKLIFEKDNPSGLPEKAESFSVPVVFGKDKTVIKIYFGNSKLDPGQLDCSKVYFVEREIESSPKIGKAAIDELLKGPTEKEKENGYFTSIQEGTELDVLSIQHGVAFANFNEKLDRGMGGSCRVSMIRSQIEQTLKQFPTVKDVQIYIGDRKDDVLQP